MTCSVPVRRAKVLNMKTNGLPVPKRSRYIALSENVKVHQYYGVH